MTTKRYEDLKAMYAHMCRTPSDINEHIPTFYEYSKECNDVVECGVRSVVSSWGFLMGLVDGQKDEVVKELLIGEEKDDQKSLTCCDLNKSSEVLLLDVMAEEMGVNFSFVEGDDTKVDLPEADIYFIDTWHIYAHLKRELSIFKDKARKYIMMHDTSIDAINGESIRCGWNTAKQSIESGYPEEDIRKGLKYAIEEFLSENKEWVVDKVFLNNNGLTILKRV